MNSTTPCPDHLEITEDLRQRLIDEGWPEDRITTHTVEWQDGDFYVTVFHTMARHLKDPPARIEYTRHSDGTIKRYRKEMLSRETWENIDVEVIE